MEHARPRSLALTRGLAMAAVAAAAASEGMRNLRNAIDGARRVYGPRVTATKNVGRDWTKQSRHSRYRPHQGPRELARRMAAMARGADCGQSNSLHGAAEQMNPLRYTGPVWVAGRAK